MRISGDKFHSIHPLFFFLDKWRQTKKEAHWVSYNVALLRLLLIAEERWGFNLSLIREQKSIPLSAHFTGLHFSTVDVLKSAENKRWQCRQNMLHFSQLCINCQLIVLAHWRFFSYIPYPVLSCKWNLDFPVCIKLTHYWNQ